VRSGVGSGGGGAEPRRAGITRLDQAAGPTAKGSVSEREPSQKACDWLRPVAPRGRRSGNRAVGVPFCGHEDVGSDWAKAWGELRQGGRPKRGSTNTFAEKARERRKG
jgi:hypothetical protein